jgi:uncharacterized protein (TIGR03083 family)
MDETTMWGLIHTERARFCDTLASFTPEQWEHFTLCKGWNVHLVAGHVLAGAEQTTGGFLKGLASSGFRFNVMTQNDVVRNAKLSPGELVTRLRATVTTTNHPPAPIAAMLGEVVAHAEDICQPLGVNSGVADEALIATLQAFANTGFPLGSKKRVEGLTISPNDLAWSHGSGPKVEGPGKALVLAMVGRTAALKDLSGDGVPELTRRLG